MRFLFDNKIRVTVIHRGLSLPCCQATAPAPCPDLRQRHRWFCAGAGGVFFRGDRWGERRGGPPVPGDNAVTRAAGRRGRGHWFARLRARNRHRHATATVRGRAGKGAWDGGKVDQGGVSQEVTSRRGTCHCTLGIGDAQRR